MSLFTIATCFVAGRRRGSRCRRTPASWRAARRGRLSRRCVPHCMRRRSPPRRRARRSAQTSRSAAVESIRRTLLLRARRPSLLPRSERGVDPVPDAARRSSSVTGRASAIVYSRSAWRTYQASRRIAVAASSQLDPHRLGADVHAGAIESREDHLRLVVLEDGAEVRAEPDGLAVDEVAAGLVLQRSTGSSGRRRPCGGCSSRRRGTRHHPSGGPASASGSRGRVTVVDLVEVGEDRLELPARLVDQALVIGPSAILPARVAGELPVECAVW